MTRTHRRSRLIASAFLPMLLLLLLAAAAQAQAPPTTPVFDSGSAAANYFFAPSAIESTARSWAQNAQDAASNIFRTLFIFEIIFIGIQGVLFKDNLGEFLASFSFKVFTACFFLWLIPNAGTVFPNIVRSFGALGQQVAASGGGATTSTPDAALGSFFGISAGLATACLGAADALHKAVGIEEDADMNMTIATNESGVITAVGEIGAATIAGGYETTNTVAAPLLGKGFAALISQIVPEFFLAGMGIAVLGCMAVVFMTWVMIVCEASIVMFGGTLFLGFAATRFTMPFAQGYLRYAINIGVKYFTFWLILSMEVHLLPSVITSSILGIAASAVLKYLTGGIFMALLPLMYPLLSLAVMSTLAYSIPAFAGSFISGSSALSATQTLGTAMTTMTQASQMLGQIIQSGGGLFFGRGRNAPGSKLSNQAPTQPAISGPAGTGAIAPVSPNPLATSMGNAVAPATMSGSLGASPLGSGPAVAPTYAPPPGRPAVAGDPSAHQYERATRHTPDEQPNVTDEAVYNDNLYPEAQFNPDIYNISAPTGGPLIRKGKAQRRPGLEALSPAQISLLSDRAFFNRLVNMSDPNDLQPAQMQAAQRILHKKDDAGKQYIFKEYVRHRKEQARRESGGELLNQGQIAASAERAFLPQDDHGRGTGGLSWGSADIGSREE